MTDDSDLLREIKLKPLFFEVLSFILRSGGPVQPTAIARSLERKLPSISRTLSSLERVGAVEARLEGRSKFYTIPTAKRRRIQAILKEPAGSLPRQFTRRGYVMHLEKQAIKELVTTRLQEYTVESEAEIRNTTIARRGAVPDIIIKQVLQGEEKRIGLELIMGSKGLERKDMLVRLFHLASALDYSDIQSLIFIIFGAIGERAERALGDIARERGNKFKVIRIGRIPARIDKHGTLVVEEDRLADDLLPKLAGTLRGIAT